MINKTNRLVVIVVILSCIILIGGDTSSLVTLERFRFFLGDPVLKPLQKLINQADESVTVGMYQMVNPKYRKPGKIALALVKAKRRGANVRVAVEKRDKWTRPTVKFFKKYDVNVRYYQDEKIQHIKAIVVDEEYAFVGSQNISGKALSGKNWESGVILHSPKISRQLKRYLIQQN